MLKKWILKLFVRQLSRFGICFECASGITWFFEMSPASDSPQAAVRNRDLEMEGQTPLN